MTEVGIDEFVAWEDVFFDGVVIRGSIDEWAVEPWSVGWDGSNGGITEEEAGGWIVIGDVVDVFCHVESGDNLIFGEAREAGENSLVRVVDRVGFVVFVDK